MRVPYIHESPDLGKYLVIVIWGYGKLQSGTLDSALGPIVICVNAPHFSTTKTSTTMVGS